MPIGTPGVARPAELSDIEFNWLVVPQSYGRARVSYVIRPDGSVGIYKVVASDLHFGALVVQRLRSVRCTPPLHLGRSVSLREEVVIRSKSGP